MMSVVMAGTVRARRPTRRKIARFACALAIGAMPFVLIPSASSAVVDLIARRVASWLGAMVPIRRPAAVVEDMRGLADRADDPAIATSGSDGQAPGLRPRANMATRQARVARVIRVGPQVVRSAIPPGGRPSAVWSESDAGKPPGVRFTAVGALGAFVRPGDILVEAEGRPLHDFADLIATVGHAYERREKFVTGRLWRAGALWWVVVEPGW